MADEIGSAEAGGAAALDASDAFVPPYPPRPARDLSVLAMLRNSRRNLLTIFDDKAFEQQLMRVQVLTRTVFVCNSPDTVRHAFIAANSAFERKSPQFRNALKPLLGDGLFVSDGATWRARRQIVSPLVHGSRMAEFGPIMVRAAREMEDRWAGLDEVDVLSEMAHLTAEVICRVLFGRALSHDAALDIVEGFHEYQRTIDQIDLTSLIGLPDWFPRRQGPAIRRSARRIRSTLERNIAAHRERPSDDGPSLIGKLLDATGHDGAPLDEEAVIDEAGVVFMAGQETTANCLAWAWYLLSQARTVERKLHMELDAVLGSRMPTPADVPALVYTRAVIEETLRLYPPVPILAREATAPETLRRHAVQAGSLVMVVPWLLHRHRRYWPHPDHFIPERFLPGAEPHDRYVYVPFSIGPRVCAGMTFGLTEAVLCLATLARSFTLRLKPGTTVEPVCRLTLRPGNTLPMTVQARSPRAA